MDGTLYFAVENNNKSIIYKPHQGIQLGAFHWVDISIEDPEYIPLKFEIDDTHNAYFSMTKGGARLSIMDSELLFNDKSAIFYDCEWDSYKAFNSEASSKIDHVKPNKFEAWK